MEAISILYRYSVYKSANQRAEQKINIPLNLHLADLKLSANKTARDGLIQRYYTIVKEMEIHGQASASMAHYYLFLGKLQFQQGLYREAKELLRKAL